MTEQEIFDKVVVHLANQKVKSTDGATDEGGICLYRGPEGRMCAVGCLLSDEEYSPDMEGRPVFMMPQLPSRLQGHLRFLERLQKAHDSSSTPEALRYALEIIGYSFHLDTSKVSLITEWSIA